MWEWDVVFTIGAYNPVACAIICAEMIVTIHQAIHAHASHDFCCVVLVFHLNTVVLILRRRSLKHEAAVVWVFLVPQQESKVITTEIMKSRISWTSWELGKWLTAVLWWMGIFLTRPGFHIKRCTLWPRVPGNALLINKVYLSFHFYPFIFPFTKSHLLVFLHNIEEAFLTLEQLTCFPDLVATLLEKD